MTEWIKVGTTGDVPADSGVCAKIGERQIAIFADAEKQNYYAIDNLCPHNQQMVLSRGLMGCEKGEPKVACPLHKHTFSLKSGKHLGGDSSMCVDTFNLKVESDEIYIEIDI